jgi:hypothetical protein
MPTTSIYYELDNSGRLVRIDGQFSPHHVVPVEDQQLPPAPLIIVNRPPAHAAARVEPSDPTIDNGARCTRSAGSDDDEDLFGCPLGEWWFI